MDDAHEMVAWLRGVLDETERECQNQDNVARTMHSTELAEMAIRAVQARIDAERAIVELHKPWNGGGRVTYCSEFEHDEQEFPCPTLCWLAYGHRFDAPGYRAEWAPEGVRPATG